MKAKLILSLATVGGLLCSSCSMDLTPQGSIILEESIETVNDVNSARNYLYVGMRSITTSGFITYPEIQMDMFNGTTINGNRGGNFANNTITSSDPDVDSYWGALYAQIGNANFVIEYTQKLYFKYVDEDDEQYDPDKALIAKRCLADAYFLRGYMYAIMFDRWCQVYDPAKGDQEGLGLPIVTVYDPTGDRSKYPGRSSQNATIKFIDQDFETAFDYLTEVEIAAGTKIAPMAIYFNTNVVKAMQARWNLWLGRYEEAYNLASELIDSKIYTLTPRDQYVKMWTDDTSNEVIWMPFMNPDELSGSIGALWISAEESVSDYIPTPGCIAMYEAAGKPNLMPEWNDIRYKAFLGTRNLSNAGTNVQTLCFNKFPGNEALRQDTRNNLQNKPKAFRLSELYLIKAEAGYYANKSDALDAVNTLRTNRIKNYKPVSVSGNELLQLIRDERTRELIGEGFRMSDLRRWGLGFSRVNSGNYVNTPAVDDLVLAVGLQVVFVPNDPRYTWPIPASEFNTNPQIAGQQNPGY